MTVMKCPNSSAEILQCLVLLGFYEVAVVFSRLLLVRSVFSSCTPTAEAWEWRPAGMEGGREGNSACACRMRITYPLSKKFESPKSLRY